MQVEKSKNFIKESNEKGSVLVEYVIALILFLMLLNFMFNFIISKAKNDISIYDKLHSITWDIDYVDIRNNEKKIIEDYIILNLIDSKTNDISGIKDYKDEIKEFKDRANFNIDNLKCQIDKRERTYRYRYKVNGNNNKVGRYLIYYLELSGDISIYDEKYPYYKKIKLGKSMIKK